MSETAGNIRRHLWQIRDHYEAALDGPRRKGSIGGSGGSKEPPAPVGLHILDARFEAHKDLAHYARVVYMACTDVNGGEITTRVSENEQRQPLELAAFLDTWADRLAEADPQEAEACERDMGRHANRLRNLALPDRRDWVQLGKCPLPAEDGDCGGQVRAYPDSDPRRDPACVECGTVADLDVWVAQLVPELSDLGTAGETISAVAQRSNIALTHVQVRLWAHRGFIQRHGKDGKGRTLYSTAAVLAYAQNQTKEAAA